MKTTKIARLITLMNQDPDGARHKMMSTVALDNQIRVYLAQFAHAREISTLRRARIERQLQERHECGVACTHGTAVTLRVASLSI